MSGDWTNSGLTDLQITWMRESAISPEIARAAGLYSVSDPKAAAKLFGRMPSQWSEHGPALAFPYQIPFQRDPVLVRGKPVKPFEQKKKDGSVALAKYVQAKGTGTHLYFGPSLLLGNALRDVNTPLWITEGERKCLSAESAGLSCLAVPGVDQWHVKGERKLHPYFAHVALEGREVFLAFDADSIDNTNVRRNELDLGRALEAAGAKVRIVRFPRDAQKLDDFLVRHERSELAALIDEAREGGLLPPDTRGPSDDAWKELWPKLRIDAKTERPRKDVDTIATVLREHPEWKDVLAHDARHERDTFLKAPPFAPELGAPKQYPRPIEDVDVTRIAVWLVKQAALGWESTPSTKSIEQAIELACQAKRYDAVQAFLKSLVWDGEPRLDAVASKYLGAEDTRYNGAVVAKWMLSAVARARTPGCQADYVLTFFGPQGKSKSTAFRVLAGDAFFSDTPPEVGTKDAHEHCVGPWIVELAELSATKKADVDALKSFITTRKPIFRHSYGKRSTEHPRRCVFAATTNDEEMLRDRTGNRRFWILRTGRIDLEALARDRDQLWAEAVHRVRAGEVWYLDDEELEAEAVHVQSQHVERDAIEDKVLDQAGQLAKRGQFVTVDLILDGLQWPLTQRHAGMARRINTILRAAGWTDHRPRVGARQRGFLSPVQQVQLVQDQLEVTRTEITAKSRAVESPVHLVHSISNRDITEDRRGVIGAHESHTALAVPSCGPRVFGGPVDHLVDQGDELDLFEVSE